jgi:hypothetical protein
LGNFFVPDSVGDEDDCETWSHHFIIVLNDQSPDVTLQQIEDFMVGVTENCGKHSSVFVSLPGKHGQCTSCTVSLRP